ncbi:MAG TPA: cytochrome c biogenesis protein CcdA [Thermoanaerobaculia bacterium]|nr:cytochrome c biogenesis protein CcdA [Thermoanaerobaculia bacterium]
MRLVRILPLLLLVAPGAFAQFGLGGDALPKASIEGAIRSASGDTVEGVVTATIEEGWHVNSSTPLDEFLIPTSLALDAATADLVSASYPRHKLQAFSFSGGKEIAVYDGTIQIPFTAKLKPGASTIRASLRYQACNDSVCLPPTNATAEFSAASVGAPPASPGQSTGFIPLSAAPKDYKPEPQDRLAKTFASSGLPLTLVLLFIGGLALNLTPCVLPLIPITLGFFAMQSDGRRSRRFALSSMYVLGLVVMYSALGVIAAIGGQMFGAWLQLPAVLVGFAVLMVVLATSMFGAFEIQPPRWITNRSQGRAGLAGALSMGLVVGIVAAPCVGPVVISLLTLVAAIGDPLTGGLMFAALAFGLGFPYLALLNVLPKPGEWMVQVKMAMGFVLVAMAFYFLRPLTGDGVFKWGVVASLLIGAGFLFLSRGVAGRAIRLACASLLLIAGAAFALPGKRGANVQWDQYDAKAIAAASASGRPVVIDFYADWCLPCKELDANTFSDFAVARELDRFVRVKVDLTLADDPKAVALARQYRVIGVPAVVFLDASGQEIRELRLNQYENAEKFLARIRQVK